jgi:hypothetical protein
MATEGGTTNAECSVGCGLVFHLTPPKVAGHTLWKETVLYRFVGGKDGTSPVGELVVGPGGALYGMTSQGGGFVDCFHNSACGTVFKLTPPVAPKTAWTERVLVDFDGPNGSSPLATLSLDTTGALYGTTTAGGLLNDCYNNQYVCGKLFKLTPPVPRAHVWTEIAIHNFTGGTDGGFPSGQVLVGANTIVGTAQTGGNIAACGGSGCGVVYEFPK